MATGAITITPGKTFDLINGERVDLAKLNQLGNPTARVDENTIGRRELINAIVEQVDASTAGLATEIIVRADADTALAASITSLTATVGANTAAITTEASVRATNDGYLASMYVIRLDANGNQTGLALTSISDPSGWTTTSEVKITANVFKVASGTTNVTPFQIVGSKARFTADVEIDGSLLVNGTVGAAAIVANSITAAQIAAGTITADRLDVSTLSAISANLGTVTAGTLTSVSITAAAITGTSSLDVGTAPNRLLANSSGFYYGTGGAQRVQIGYDTPGGQVFMRTLNSSNNPTVEIVGGGSAGPFQGGYINVTDTINRSILIDPGSVISGVSSVSVVGGAGVSGGISVSPTVASIFLQDTNLYRDSANVLKTDDSLVVVGSITGATITGSTLTSTGAINSSGSADIGGNLRVVGNIEGETPSDPELTVMTGVKVELNPGSSNRSRLGCGTDSGSDRAFTSYLVMDVNGVTRYIPYTDSL
jgi:cytoskeletal protein CcmA (bactofilin family)